MKAIKIIISLLIISIYAFCCIKIINSLVHESIVLRISVCVLTGYSSSHLIKDIIKFDKWFNSKLK